MAERYLDHSEASLIRVIARAAKFAVSLPDRVFVQDGKLEQGRESPQLAVDGPVRVRFRALQFSTSSP